jgi:hypothetical protein
VSALLPRRDQAGLIAGNSLAAVNPVAGFSWSPWVELGVVAVYPVVLLLAGSWLLAHRDA